MAHEIATINGVAAMAYQGATPWHQLGATMEATADVQAALTAAQLDWEVLLRPLYYRHKEQHCKVPQRFAVVRDVDGKLLSTVGSDYAPLQNSDAFGVLQPACEQFGITIETAGALNRGERVWMLAKMPTSYEPVAGDKVGGYFLVMNHHDGLHAYTCRPTMIRVVCANTLAMAVSGSEAMIQLRHTRTQVETIEQVQKLVTNMTAMMVKTNESFARLAARHLTEVELVTYIDEVLGDSSTSSVLENRKATIFQLAASGKGVEFAPGTAWAAFNAVTEYVDHVRPLEARTPRTIANANQSAIFGVNARLKTRALVVAARLAA